MREREELALEIEELNAALAEAIRDRDGLVERFRAHVDASAMTLARDLVSILNRAGSLGVSITPDVDDPGGDSYTVMWVFDVKPRYLDVAWHPGSAEWTFVARRPDGEAGA